MMWASETPLAGAMSLPYPARPPAHARRASYRPGAGNRQHAKGIDHFDSWQAPRIRQANARMQEKVPSDATSPIFPNGFPEQ
jgi:hypothetical protein